MTIGKLVAERYKKQYYRKRTGWKTYDTWKIQPEQVYLILLELKSKSAVDALMGNKSWTRKIQKDAK